MHKTAEAVPTSITEFAAFSTERAVLCSPLKLRKIEPVEPRLLIPERELPLEVALIRRLTENELLYDETVLRVDAINPITIEKPKKPGPNAYHVEELAAELWMEDYYQKNPYYDQSDLYMLWTQLPEGKEKDTWRRYGLYTYSELRNQRRNADDNKARMKESENVGGLMLAFRRACDQFPHTMHSERIIGYDVIGKYIWNDFRSNINRLIREGSLSTNGARETLVEATSMFEEARVIAEHHDVPILYAMREKLQLLDSLADQMGQLEEVMGMVEPFVDESEWFKHYTLELPQRRRILYRTSESVAA
jgi:hypothetical protein